MFSNYLAIFLRASLRAGENISEKEPTTTFVSLKLIPEIFCIDYNYNRKCYIFILYFT